MAIYKIVDYSMTKVLFFIFIFNKVIAIFVVGNFEILDDFVLLFLLFIMIPTVKLKYSFL